jgi:hypothetical protein
VQGVHTRVTEILYEASARSALELIFEFKEERARWAHQNRLKSQKGRHTRVTKQSEEGSTRSALSRHKECQDQKIRRCNIGGGREVIL